MGAHQGFRQWAQAENTTKKPRNEVNWKKEVQERQNSVSKRGEK